jgi:hypothetical protein
MPGRKWYAIAALVFLLGMAFFGVFLFTRLKDLTGGLQQVVVPGEAELVLEKPGSYTIFHEHESVVGGRYYSSPDEVPGLKVEVVSSETGEPVSLDAPGASTSYSLGGRSGVSIFVFEIDQPGTYRLSAGFPDGRQEQQLVLAVGQGFGQKLLLTIFGALAIGLASFILAISIAVVTFWKRRKALRVAPGPQPKPA